MVCPCALSNGQMGGRKTRRRAYRTTNRNRTLYRNYKRGKSIGFTARSSLKAKGILPRTSGKYRGLYVLGPKYSGTGKNKILKKQTDLLRPKA